MKIVTATEAKTHFGKYMAAAMLEPIVVSKGGHETMIMLSKEEYDWLLQASEDRYWGEKAMQVRAKGNYIGVEEGQKIIERLLKEEQEFPDEQDV
jgi:prevent-host-death family protein